MIKFGKLTYPRGNIVKEIIRIKNLGFDYAEIGVEAPTYAKIMLNNKPLIIKPLKRFTYPPIGHTAWWYDFGSPYEIVRNAWVNQAMIDIKAANELGINLLNFHFSYISNFLIHEDKFGKIILENHVKSLDKLSKFAKKLRVKLMLENGEEKFGYYRYVLDRVPDIKVHFDVGHAFISGGMPTIKRFVSYFGGRIEHIHIHDNNGKKDEHLALRKGKINWKEVISILKKYNYDKTITFEVFKSDKDLLKSREYFRKLWY